MIVLHNNLYAPVPPSYRDQSKENKDTDTTVTHIL